MLVLVGWLLVLVSYNDIVCISKYILSNFMDKSQMAYNVHIFNYTLKFYTCGLLFSYKFFKNELLSIRYI